MATQSLSSQATEDKTPAKVRLMTMMQDALYVVQDIRRLRADGMSYQKIADALNGMGVSAKQGGQWDRVRVFKIMQNAA